MILKNPTFRIDKDTDIINIINIISQNKSGGTGSELDQLTSTIRTCVSHEEVREFLNIDYIKNFLLSPQGKAFHQIPIKQSADDLRNDLAKRIYDIRCRIVHTKADGGKSKVDLLLPFSKEAKLLSCDVEIVKFIARAVLINASTVLRI